MSISAKVENDLPKYIIWTIFFLNLYPLYQYDINYQPYVTNEWLINYAGGFVRRGMIGQIILYLTKVTSVHPWVFVYFLQSIAYLLITLFAIKKLKCGINIIGLVFLLSPVVFLFEIYDQGGLGRKELIYISFLAINGYFLDRLNEEYKTLGLKYYLYISIFMVLGVLTHEAFIFYYPLFLLQLACYDQLRNFRLQIIPITLALLAFGIVVAHKGNQSIVKAIFNSWSPYINEMTRCNPNYGVGSPICDLGSTVMNITLSNTIVPKMHHFLIIPALIILGYSTVFLLAFTLNNGISRSVSYHQKISVVLVLATVSITPLFIIAIDYGRWVHVFVTGLFFALPSKLLNKNAIAITDLPICRMIIAIFLLFTFSWNIPHTRSESLSLGMWSYSKRTAQNLISIYSELSGDQLPITANPD